MHKLHFATSLSQFSRHPLKNYECRRSYCVPSGYLTAYIDPEPTVMKPIHLATTQLERPIPPASMRFFERYSGAKKVLADLSGEKNVVFGGDMSWDDKADMPFPLREGWVDAACSLERKSWTYDAFWNEKAEEFNGCVDYESMKKRSDRFVCKLQDYKLNSIQVIGDEPVGVEYTKVPEGHVHQLMQRPETSHF
jgi:tyrosyl-DNA phosphodiesterase 2